MLTLTILTIILFSIGAIQGLVFGLMLLTSKKHNRLANKLLATILLLLSYRLIVQTMRLFGLGYYDGWYYIMIDLSWATGALLYFYVKALTVANFHIRKIDFIHFLPVLVQVAFSVFVRIQNIYWDGTKDSLSWLGYWGYVVWMNNSTIYVIASILIICYSFQALKRLNSSKGSIKIEPQKLYWINKIIYSFMLYFSIVLIILLGDFIIYNLSTDESYFYFERFYYYPFFAGLSLLTYWLGIEGFKRKDDKGLTVKPVLSTEQKEHLSQIAEDLKRIVNERELFKKSDLTLRDLAKEINIKPYVLSNCFRDILNTKFNDYINALRIKEVQRLLENPKLQKHSLLKLALDAGFNSKSSFSRAVQKQLGHNPSELKKKILNDQASIR